MNMRFGPEEASYSTLDYAYMLRALQYDEISTLKNEPANHIMAIRNGKISDNVIRSCPHETIELSKVAITYLIGDVIKMYSVLVDDKFQVTQEMVVKMLLTYGHVSVLCENVNKVIERVGDFASEVEDEELLIQTAAAVSLVSKCYQVLLIAHQLLSIYQVVNHMLVDDAGDRKMKDSIQKILYNKASTTKFCEDTDGEHQSPLRMVAMLEFVNRKVLAVLTAEKDPNHILYLHEIEMDYKNSTFTVGNFVEGVHDEQTQLLRLDFHTFESTDPKIIEILAYHKYRTTVSPLHGIISTMKDAMMIELGEPKFRFLAKNFLL